MRRGHIKTIIEGIWRAVLGRENCAPLLLSIWPKQIRRGEDEKINKKNNIFF